MAITSLLSAEKYYVKNGRFYSAANCSMEVAELFEQEGNYEKSYNYYNIAKKCFQIDGNAPTKLNNCTVKIANLHLQTNKYSEAACCFCEVALELLKHELGSFGAGRHFVMCVFCYMAANLDNEFIENELEKFKDLDNRFRSSVESTFLDKFIKVYKKGDVDKFAQTCAEYDTKFPADPTLTNIWLQIKTNLESKQDKDLS
jgi:hypothetical protein